MYQFTPRLKGKIGRSTGSKKSEFAEIFLPCCLEVTTNLRRRNPESVADSTRAGWQSVSSSLFLVVLYLIVTKPFYSMPEADDIRFKLLSGARTTRIEQTKDW